MDYLFSSDRTLVGLETSFESLPVDAYTNGGFRFRRYSAFQYAHGTIDLLPPETFTQSSTINTFLGDVVRTYPPIKERTYRHPQFKKMFAHFDDHTMINIGSHVGVHQIRVCKTGDAVMAPEGRHQDGFDRIAVFMIGVVNLAGGHLRLSQNQIDDAFLDVELKPGDYAVINDRALFHNASPIELINETQKGYVDFFVLTSVNDERVLH